MSLRAKVARRRPPRRARRRPSTRSSCSPRSPGARARPGRARTPRPTPTWTPWPSGAARAGLAATSIAWGPWAGVRHGRRRRRRRPLLRPARPAADGAGPASRALAARSTVTETTAVVADGTSTGRVRSGARPARGPAAVRCARWPKLRRRRRARPHRGRGGWRTAGPARPPCRTGAPRSPGAGPRQVAAVLGYASARRHQPRPGRSATWASTRSPRSSCATACAETGLELPATLVFDHPTPDALAAPPARRAVGDAPVAAVTGTADHVHGADEPIAIVGMGCRLPRRRHSPERAVAAGRPRRDAIGGVPGRPRLGPRRLYDADPDDPAPATPARAGSSTTPAGSTRLLRHLARARRWRWTRSSGCCWRPPGRRSSARASTRRRCAAAGPACSSASTARTTRHLRRAPASGRGLPRHRQRRQRRCPAASPTRSASRARR